MAIAEIRTRTACENLAWDDSVGSSPGGEAGPVTPGHVTRWWKAKVNETGMGRGGRWNKRAMDVQG